MKDYVVGAQLIFQMRMAYLNPNKIKTLDQAERYIRRYTPMFSCQVRPVRDCKLPHNYEAEVKFYEEHGPATEIETITRFGPSPQQAKRNALISYLCYFRSQDL